MLQVIEAVIAVTIIAELSVCKTVTVSGEKNSQNELASISQATSFVELTIHTHVKHKTKPQSYLQFETL